MSRENVELLQRAFEEINARLEHPRELFADEYEVDLTDFLGGEVFSGFTAADAQMREYWEMFDDFRYEIEEVIHANDERVVVRMRDGGRIKGSDAEVSAQYYDVVTFRDGKIVRVSAHADKSRALEAAGLEDS